MSLSDLIEAQNKYFNNSKEHKFLHFCDGCNYNTRHEQEWPAHIRCLKCGNTKYYNPYKDNSP